jgi:two-component system, OmpR family, alkaline phosphatase synthesis response regulator PhoP
MKILVADDSPTIRGMVTAQLRADGYEVLEAVDGQQALELARSGDPDLLVLDKIMPGLDGLEVVRALREDPQLRPVPVVMLTEQTGETDVLGGFTLGVRDYIPKPFSPDELSTRVRRALQRAAP